MTIRLDNQRFVQEWEAARGAYYDALYWRMVGKNYAEAGRVCHHPPVKADGTHDRRVPCVDARPLTNTLAHSSFKFVTSGSRYGAFCTA